MTRQTIQPSPLALVVPSLAIALVLGLQFYAAQHLRVFWPKFRMLQPLHQRLTLAREKAFWPFIDYPMYSYPKNIGDGIRQYAIYGRLTDGTEVKIEPDNLGVNYWIFMYGLVTSLRKNNAEDVGHFARMFEQRNGVTLQSIRLEDSPLILTESGVQPSPPKVVTEIKF